MAILLPSRSPFYFIKLSLFLLTILSLTSLAYLKIPQTTKPQALYTSLKPWLTTPCLFIAIHLIIAIIWKLSDYHTHPDHDGNSAKLTSFNSSPPSELLQPGFSMPNSAPSPALESTKLTSYDNSPAELLENDQFPMPSPTSEPNYAPPQFLESKNNLENSTKLTSFDNSPAELLENEFPMPRRTLEPNYAPPPLLESKNNLENSTKLTSFDNSPAELLQHKFPMPGPTTELNYAPPSVFESRNSVEVEEEEEEENESMEETWRAIVEKKKANTEKNTNTKRNTKTDSRRWRGVVGDSNEEMNRKFDDFIKGKRDQLRLERHESNQRRLLAGN